MHYENEKKEFDVEYSHMINCNGYDLAVFSLKMVRPVKVDTAFDIHDIHTSKGVTGIKFSEYSDVAKAYKFKGDVLLSMPDDVISFVKKTHDEKIDALKDAAKKDPERWFWAVGGDTHQLYLTPDSETGTTYREDLKKVETTLEKNINWFKNPLREKSAKIDRQPGLYTETGWFEVPHSEVMRVYNEIIAAKDAKKAEAEDKKKAIFEKAKQTGEKQIIETYSVECSDPDEECDVDIVTVYAMPDGTTKTTQNHTW